MVYVDRDGGTIGACWVCGKQIYANKPASERTIHDMKRIFMHVIDNHPEEAMRRMAA